MKQYFIYSLVFLTTFIFVNPSSAQKHKIKTVVIDAGHGGKDPGAVSGKYKEKDITLSIALKVGKYIKDNIKGVKVVYTRKNDKFIELHRRSEIANEIKADLFISIHVNASKNRTAKGTSCFVMGLHMAEQNLEVAKLENSVILTEENYKTKYQGFDPQDAESDMILSLYQTAFLEQSTSIAYKIQNQFEKRASRVNRGVKQAGLMVLWNCTMPAVLVETGFITNNEERKYLTSDYGQSIIASAIYRAVKDYKKKVESGDSFRHNGGKAGQTPPETSEFEIDKSIVFKVQLAASPTKIKKTPKNFYGFKDINEYFYRGKYRYTTGSTSVYEEILETQKEVRKKVPDAYVVVFQKGKKITVKQALAIIRKKKK